MTQTQRNVPHTTKSHRPPNPKNHRTWSKPYNTTRNRFTTHPEGGASRIFHPIGPLNYGSTHLVQQCHRRVWLFRLININHKHTRTARTHTTKGVQKYANCNLRRHIKKKNYSLSKYPSGQICRQTARSVTYRWAGAQVRQLSWPAPAQVSHDSWQGQQTPPWLGKLRGGQRLTQVLQRQKVSFSGAAVNKKNQYSLI